MADAQPYVSPNNPDNIIEDNKSLEIKDKVLARQKTSSVYNSISKVAMFLGTFLLTTGAAIALPALIAGTAVAASTIGILAIGAAFLTGGVATDYMSSRIWQGCNFDNLEANADSTARHLVKELKANNMCMVEHGSPGAQRSDWSARIEAQRQQQAAAANR